MTDVTESPLLQQIFENPDDREVRLVFADWLEEQGDPRGQVVRMQCQLEGMKPHDPGYSTLRGKERKLFKEYGAFGSVPKQSGARFEHRAGFVEWITLTPARLLKFAAEIFQSAPVREIKLKGASARFKKIAELPQLAQVRSLVLKQSKINDDGLRSLVNSPYLQGLETLELHSNELQSPGAIMGQSPLIESLRTLRITGDHVDDRTVELICGAPCQLRSVEFGYSVTDSALEFIGQSEGLRSLNSLEAQMGWDDGGFSASGLQAFGDSEFDEPLKELSIRPIIRGFATAFAAPRFRHLEKLSVTSVVLATEDVVRIIEHLPHLMELDLTDTRSRDAVARALARSPVLGNLRKLYLTGNQLTRAGVEALLDSEYFSPTTDFYLTGNSINQQDMKAIQSRAGKSFGGLSRSDPYHMW